MPHQHQHEVVVGVGGGIAAYKAATLVSRLVQRGIGVTVAMSEAATRFITPLTFQALSGRPVFSSLWQDDGEGGLHHLRLTERAQLLVIAPATANLLAKFALGMADDLLSTMALASACPLLLAPAMNTRMWVHPATQGHVQTLRHRGAQFVDPQEGWLAEQQIGVGRMAEPEQILDGVVALLK